MNKKYISFALLIFASLTLFGCDFKKSPESETPEDEVRVTTPLQDKAAVKKLFMEKYDTPVNEMKIEEVEQDATHMRGTISLEKEGAEPSEKLFLAVRDGNVWEVVFEGEGGQIPCAELEKNEFPEALSANCAG